MLTVVMLHKKFCLCFAEKNKRLKKQTRSLPTRTRSFRNEMKIEKIKAQKTEFQTVGENFVCIPTNFWTTTRLKQINSSFHYVWPLAVPPLSLFMFCVDFRQHSHHKWHLLLFVYAEIYMYTWIIVSITIMMNIHKCSLSSQHNHELPKITSLGYTYIIIINKQTTLA